MNLVNKDVSSSSCNSARDYIVEDLSDCPGDATQINNYQDAYSILGKKCCILITKFNMTFWQNRYNYDTLQCKQAITKIQNYLVFYQKINS